MVGAEASVYVLYDTDFLSLIDTQVAINSMGRVMGTQWTFNPLQPCQTQLTVYREESRPTDSVITPQVFAVNVPLPFIPNKS